MTGWYVYELQTDGSLSLIGDESLVSPLEKMNGRWLVMFTLWDDWTIREYRNFEDAKKIASGVMEQMGMADAKIILVRGTLKTIGGLRPRFIDDCNHCLYLGGFRMDGRDYDLYKCSRCGYKARWGNHRLERHVSRNDEAFRFFVEGVRTPIYEAVRRAFLTPDRFWEGK